MLITKDPDVIDKDRDEAYKNLDKLREFIEKMRRDSNQACAVLYQSTCDLVGGNKSREKFIQNLAEYFFDNLWQDDRI